MEYTIYNESLVQYALRDTKTGSYICDTSNYSKEYPELSTSIHLQNVEMFVSKTQIEDIAKHCGLQIRKVKVIDIGEVNENI